MLEELAKVRYFDPTKIRTPIWIYFFLALIIICNIVGLTVLSFYFSDSQYTMMGFLTSLVVMCVLCTVILMCVSRGNNYKCRKRDEGINDCADRWNREVFEDKGARIVTGRLGAWLILEIDQAHFVSNMM